ncbi:MAG: hypothetical protein CML46_13840 [Rhodobacteraceae bacterium]|nr:hypothetical protein [Paracoccaceae bacterium]MBR28010.1 hypothetical protein [Paracoccaceae bacterium]
MTLLIRVFRIVVRFSTLIVFLAMLGLNVATLTISGVAAAANGALAAVGVGTVAARSAAAAAPRRAAVRAATRRVSARVTRGAARNAGAVLAESVPWLGAAAVVGFTAMDLRDACATMEDLRALDEAMGPNPALRPESPGPGPSAADGAMLDRAAARVCALEVPTLAEIRAGVGGGMGDGLGGGMPAPP